MSVLGEDGIFRSRTIDGVHTFGERADPARVLAAAATARSHGNPHASPIDGKQRFLSVVKVDKYPLFAVVAADADIALAPYRQTRQQVLTWATVVGLITVLTGALLLTQANRLEASRRLTQETEAAFRATLEGSMDAVTLLRPMRDAAGALLDWTVVDCNSLAATLMGRKREQVLGHSVCELAPSIRSGGFLKFFEHVLNTQRRMHAEVPATEAHLAGQWLHHQLVPLENGVACITRDVTDKHLAESRLAALARHDALTSIFNRRHFQQTLHDGVARAARTGEPLALLYVDLDGFKAINDKHGHAAGDAVLVEVARRLKAVVRTTDTVGRLGGDEFAVLAENAGGEANVQELCARIVGALRAPHVLSATHSTFATPSVGLAIFDGAESAQALCERADAAMYRAKSAGKSRWEMADVRAQVRAVVGASEGSARNTRAAVLI